MENNCILIVILESMITHHNGKELGTHNCTEDKFITHPYIGKTICTQHYTEDKLITSHLNGKGLGTLHCTQETNNPSL